MNYGRITGEPIDLYHAADCVSCSKISVFLRNPELYRDRFVTKTAAKDEPTDAMIIGQALDTLVIEGFRSMHERFYVVPEGVGNKKTADKAIRANLALDHPGKQELSFDEFQLIRRMQDALNRNPVWCELTSRGEGQVTYRLHGQHLDVQVRPDWLNLDGCKLTDGYPYIVDLKSIDKLPDDDPDHLKWKVASFGYHRQGFLYPRIVAEVSKFDPSLPPPRMFFGFVEKEEPHKSLVVELSETDIEIGERQVTDALMRLRQCLATGVWSKPQQKIQSLSLPFRYVKQVLESTQPFLEAV